MTTNETLARALLAGKTRKAGLTTVSEGRMFYHDNMIVTQPSPTVLRVSLAGYRTRTTADKINSVLAAANAEFRVNRNGEVRSTDGATEVYVSINSWVAIPIPLNHEPIPKNP
jgi:hypothetical protein